ncbi:MAG: glycosyltransferase family 39 protein [Solirubrobacterales bacterium]
MKLLGGRSGWTVGRFTVEPWMVVLGLILAVALVLRLWGAKWGLPFAYLTDEERVYVKNAARMAYEGGINPHYFQNPPLYTYMLRAVFAVLYPGSEPATILNQLPDRENLYLVGRVISALMGTITVWLTYLGAQRFFEDRRVSLLAAALMTVSFLPVFYAHAALNNVPAMTFAALSLVGTAGVLKWGRTRDYVLGGVGAGLATATKYPDGVVVIPLLTAALLAPGEQRVRLRGLGIALGLAAASFVVANPYSVIHFSEFHADLTLQGEVASRDKIGGGDTDGFRYYLSTFGWGFGYLATAAAVLGAVLAWFRKRSVFWVLVPVVPIFFVYMALRARHFGRWMLPTYPILCMTASYAVWRLVDLLPARRAVLRRVVAAVGIVAVLAQGAVYAVHNDIVLAEKHTYNMTRSWMARNLPTDAKIIVEPLRTEVWPRRWPNATDQLFQVPTDFRENEYARYLRPGLLDIYRRRGYCWVVASSQFWAPYLDDAEQAPSAAAYYRALKREGTPVFKASPWGGPHNPGGPGEDRVGYNPDLSYNFYALPYRRPGPMVVVYRLHGGRCDRQPAEAGPSSPAGGNSSAPGGNSSAPGGNSSGAGGGGAGGGGASTAGGPGG